MRLERTEIRLFHEISLKLEDRVTLFSWSISYCLGFPGGSAGKESARNAGDQGSIPELGRSPEEEGKATHSSILACRIPWTV